VIEVGRIEAIFRYPVKSMAGHQIERAKLGWHGLTGDRRLALRRVNDVGGFPWLTATKLPALIQFAPIATANEEDLPTHVRTPEGSVLPTFSDELASEITRLHDAPVQMLHFRNGIFDEAPVSVITSDTVREIGRLAAHTADARRFRPNIVVQLNAPVPFAEDTWVGGSLSFGADSDAPSVAVTMRDERCSMINLDPETAASSPQLLKTVVRVRENKAGVYCAVTRTGEVAVGQKIYLRPTEIS
jgi:uncharacterized protein YcbX